MEKKHYVLFLFLICSTRPVFTKSAVDYGPSNKFVSSTEKPTPLTRFAHEVQLDHDGNYWLFWNISGSNITFETHVKTRGYVGFGLSTDGNMYPSDVVVGWIKSDGTVHFKDCHTTGKYAPLVDGNEDWYLLKGMENGFGTVLTFTRQLDTCDKNDTKITKSTIKVIYSYHPEDPDTIQTMTWHGTARRGSRSLRLLSSNKAIFNKPSDAFNIDFTSTQFFIPTKDTHYQCSIHRMPTLATKHHMIRYEPIVQKNNSEYVHHIELFNCPDATEADVGRSYDCFNGTPSNLLTCRDVIAAWAVGGDGFSLPEHVGYPIGVPGRSSFLKLQMHYNNPSLKPHVEDNSGMRLVLTSELRKHDAGGMHVGVGIHDMHLIPPHEKEFTSTGLCSSQCTSKVLPKNGIRVYALYQHAHLLGTSISTRLIRGNTELPPIAEDHHYDYAYQDVLVLNGEREVRRGDSIITECKYDSRKRQNITLGGLSVRKEMCISLLYYYPKISMGECFSDPIYDNIRTDTKSELNDLFSWNWNDAHVRKRFQSLVNSSTHVSYCDIRKHYKYKLFHTRIPRPEHRYKAPSHNCR